MARVLHITNGDCAVQVMKQAGLDGDFLPWRDILHDGPVQANLTLPQLSQIRAQFIAHHIVGEDQLTGVQNSFSERDECFARLAEYDKVMLWFENDLYDQLQLLQILAYLQRLKSSLSLIQGAFYLGRLSPDELLALLPLAQTVSPAQLQLGKQAWRAFVADTPLAWMALMTDKGEVLPYLSMTVTRLLQQYPDKDTGLCRIAWQSLLILTKGEQTAADLFSLYQQTESPQYLTDSSFCAVLAPLLNAKVALIHCKGKTGLHCPLADQLVSISDFGRQVLSGQASAFAVMSIDRWIGGVHISQDNLWCWDSQLTCLVSHSTAKN